MISIDELHQQNHQIAELAKTLSYLFQDREMCDTGIACELFERYRDKFDNHVQNNREIYSSLLKAHDKSAHKMADRFLEGEKELKKLFNKYQKKWCANGLHVNNHDKFLQETGEMFDLVWDRIQAENEQLYPLVRRQSQGT